MRRRLFLAAFALPLAVLGSTHGCSDEQPVEDFCAFMSDKSNCYADFHKDLGDKCGSFNSADVKGQFIHGRAALDICTFSSGNLGGSVVLDPPIDLTKDLAGNTPLVIKLMGATGLECGSITYQSKYSFAFTINPPPGADAGVDGGQVGSGENIQYLSGTVSSTQVPGRNTVDVACTAPDVVVVGQVFNPESHHFNLNQITEGSSNYGCGQFADIVPQAIVELTPGGVDVDGSLRVQINFPPQKFENNGNVEVIAPDVVYYLDCLIPADVQSCHNGVKDEDKGETDVDCGGPQSAPGCPASCAAGQLCSTDCDCAAGTACTVDAMSGIRQCIAGIPTLTNCPGVICTNKKQDSTETDVDCGGGCPGCAFGQKCSVDSDCMSSTCMDGKCTEPKCDDVKKNGTESDVDCGGGACPACAIGKICMMPTDCASGVCGVSNNVNVCTTCPDMAKNGNETDVDCGGDICPKCADGKICVANTDCLSSSCSGGECVSCSDMLKNGTESDVDCGGANCPKCPGTKQCSMNSDCASNSCVGGVCRGCDDMIQNGNETDIDCGGGSCAACADGKVCAGNTDCANNRCFQNICISCMDNKKTASETDIDCGGASCPKCAEGKSCILGTDCLLGVCMNKICTTCGNGMKDGMESDTDCGGGTCPKCGELKGCALNTDCVSGICIAGACKASCADMVKDGNESDIDCGGPDCAKCSQGKTCTVNSDCSEDTCQGNVCVSIHCGNAVKDANESAADCGGPDCAKCADGQACVDGNDCVSGGCVMNLCSPCGNGVKDGTETDKDCGGTCATKCVAGQTCVQDADCTNAACDMATHVCL